MPVSNPIDCFKKYGVKDLSNQLQKRIEEGANPYEAAREIILAEHRRLHDTVNDIRTVGKLKKEPYIEPKDISQQLKKLKEKPSVSVQMPGEVKKPEVVEPKPAETTPPTAPKEVSKAEPSKTKTDVYNSPLLKSKASDFEILYVPRSIQEEAYKNDKANQNREGGAQTIDRIIQRGGYSIEELNKLLPNWRELLPKSESATLTAPQAEAAETMQQGSVKNVKSFEERTDKEHASYIKEKFAKEFVAKGVPQDQVDAAIALMDARAKASGLGDYWYRQIEDVRSGEFESGEIKYQGDWKKVLVAAALAISPINKKTFVEQKPNPVLKYSDNVSKEPKVIEKLVKDYFKINGEFAPSDVIERAIELWHIYGRPRISGDSTSKDERAYANKTTTTGYNTTEQIELGNITDFEEYIAEIAHAAQYVSKAKLDVLDYVYRSDYEKIEYERKGSVEYDAHKLIEPYLANYVLTGKKGELLVNDTNIGEGKKQELKPVLDKYGIKFQNNKGAVETLANGRKVIHALESPDFSTMVHEIAHVFEDEISQQERKVVENWAGTKGWTNETSEKFARGFERYLRDGQAPNAELKTLFQKFKDWLTSIYQSLKGSPISKNVSPDVKKVFDRLLTDKNAAAETMQQEAGGQPSGEKLTAEPPRGEPPPTSSGGIYVERPATELSFRGLQDVANEFGYEDVKSRDRVSDLQERQNAINTSKKWAEKGEYEKNVNNLLSEIEKRERVPTAEQRIILEMYLANEKQKLRDIADKSSPEFDKQLQKVKRIKEVGNIARSEAGAALRVNEGRSLPHPINDYADAMTAMAEANSVEVLTDAQKAEVERLVTTYEKRSKEAEAKVLAMEQRMMEIEAAKEVGQIRQYKKAAKKRTAEQLKQERDKIITSLKEKWANAGKDVLSSDIPFRRQIAAIVPDVKKLVANLVESGVNELSQIIDNVHATISEFIPEIGKDDIKDIIGGKYNRKQKRSELAKKVADLKTEVNLIDRLQDLLKGEEPKTEKRKIERNQKIQDLRRQIKDLSGFESELAKAADELISQKQKEAKKLDKDLSKIEKEEDAAEERAKKEEEAKLERERKEAERERVRLEKEFEKEKNREEKEKLKSAVQEAKRAEKMLSYKLPGERKLEEFKNRAQRTEQDIRAKIEAGDFEKEDKPTSVFDSKDLKEAFPIQYREMLDAIAAKEDAQRDYDIAVYKAEQAKRGSIKKIIDWGSSIIATTKALKSGIDDSAVMMQNVVAMVSHPRSAVKALREHALDAVSEKRFRRSLTEIHNSPLWDLIEKSGLDITDPQSLKEQNKEEVFDKNLLNKDFKIGGKKFNVGKYLTRPFERAFTSLGNAMRVNMFARITEKWAEEGKTFENSPEDYKALATLLNTETGRGKLHTQIQRSSQLITAGIWSPRLMASRLNMLGVSDVLLPFVKGKGYYAGLSPKIRQIAIADMVKFIGAGISLMGFAALQGADVDDDPESPTFGTIQVGDKKYNTWGGFTPYVKTFVQGATGKRNIRGERKDVTRSKILGSFIRSRLTPAAGVATNLLTGRDFANRPITAEGEIMNLMAPLSVMGIIDGLKKDGMVGLLNQGLPSFVGVGVSDERDFEPENKNQERKQNKPKGKERKD